ERPPPPGARGETERAARVEEWQRNAAQVREAEEVRRRTRDGRAVVDHRDPPQASDVDREVLAAEYDVKETARSGGGECERRHGVSARTAGSCPRGGFP